MSKMLRFTEAEFLARVQANLRSTPPDVLAFIEATRLPGEIIGSQTQAAGGCADETLAGWVMLPYPVGANRVWRNFNGRMVANPEAVEWKRVAADLMAGRYMFDGDVLVEYILHPRKNKNGSSSKTRLDCDAPLKALLDSLSGVCYTDDKQVVRLVGSIGDPVINGGLSVRVMAI